MSKYKPFKNVNKLLISALYDAQLYEFSRLDAGVCGEESDKEYKKTQARMAAYAKKEKQLREKQND